MKFAATISLILLFAVTQYARQLSYIECKVTNIFKADVVKCDCEKTISPVTANDARQSIPVKIHFHPSADEFFVANHFVKSAGQFYTTVLRQYNKLSVTMKDGYNPAPYRPPRNIS